MHFSFDPERVHVLSFYSIHLRGSGVSKHWRGFLSVAVCCFLSVTFKCVLSEDREDKRDYQANIMAFSHRYGLIRYSRTRGQFELDVIVEKRVER